MLVYLHKKETRQFFEGRLDGASIFMRAGRQGEDGESTRRNFATVIEARREFEKILSVALSRGFVKSRDPREAEEEEAAAAAAQMADDLTVETEDGERHERNPDLEAAILRAPDDRSVYEVYADWLQDRRDPRGKLIALQCRLQDGVDESVRAAESTYRERNAWCLLGADYQILQSAGLEWRYGYIRRARLPIRHRPVPDLPAVVGRFLALPVSRFLEELELGFADNYGNGAPMALGSLVGALSKDSLRQLALRGIADEDPAGAAAINVFRALRTLRLPARRIAGVLDLPVLETLEVLSVPAADVSIHRLPRLETLRIPGLSGWNEGLSALFRGEGPAFRRLSLPGAQRADALVRALVSSPLFARLTALELTGSDVTDEGVAVLLAGERRALTSLDLGATRVSEACKGRVTSAGIAVLRGRVDERAARGDDEDEYDEDEYEEDDEFGEPRSDHEPDSETYDEEAAASGGDDAQEGFTSLADGEAVAEQEQQADEIADVAEEEGEEAAAELVIENEQAKFEEQEAEPEELYPYDEDSGDG